MNDVEKLFLEDMKRNTFSEAVADDDFDVVDSLVDPSDDDNSAESEDM